MSFKLIKQRCHMFAEKFPGNVKIYLFGSRAREAVAPPTPEEEFDISKGAFEKARDIDLLFEVDMETFLFYEQECQKHSLNFFTNIPYDPMDLYWEYHSPKKLRLSAVLDTLKINMPMITKINRAFNNIGEFDIIILPFYWRKNKRILRIINAYDKNFSKKLERDALPIFEKKKSKSVKNLTACNRGNGENCCKNSGKIHANDCGCKL